MEKLFKLMLELKSRGVGIIFVTHFLDQVYAVCDRITVLRDGEMMGSMPVSETDTDALIQLMVGRRMDAVFATAGFDAATTDELPFPDILALHKAIVNETFGVAEEEKN